MQIEDFLFSLSIIKIMSLLIAAGILFKMAYKIRDDRCFF